MPNYINKKLQEYSHVTPTRLHSCPYHPEPKKYGSEAQAPLPPDATPCLDKAGIKRVQQIVGSILYYVRAVDMTVLMGLSSIEVGQTKATEKTNVLTYSTILRLIKMQKSASVRPTW
jgi:hypothetical protein